MRIVKIVACIVFVNDVALIQALSALPAIKESTRIDALLKQNANQLLYPLITGVPGK